MQTSFESPAKLASTTNQLSIGGIDFIITNIINNESTALKLLVFICLFNKSNLLIPLYSILIKYRPIKPNIKGNTKLKKLGKKPVKFKLKKELKKRPRNLSKIKKNLSTKKYLNLFYQVLEN